MFTFLSVIRQNFEYKLRIFYNFRVKTQKSMECAFAFLKYYFFFFLDFLKNIILFTLKSIFYNERCPKFRKNQWFSNIFTFLSVILPNFEYFRINTQKSTEFDIAFLKNYSFILNLLIKIILFTLKIIFL